MEERIADEYEDPELYDKENEIYKPELAFLLKWAENLSGPIVDLACGTGRLTIPLAEKGYRMIGIDSEKRMLELGAKKADRLNLKIEWIEQDCTRLKLLLKSPLIYSVGNSFQHFLTNEEQDGLLSSVHHHLQPDGLFIFGTRFPNDEELLQPKTEEFWRSYFDSERKATVDVSTISTYNPLTQVQDYITVRRYRNDKGQTIDENRTSIKLRYVYPQEMERMLAANGLEILEAYSSWDGKPLDKDATEMIFVCKRRMM